MESAKNEPEMAQIHYWEIKTVKSDGKQPRNLSTESQPHTPEADQGSIPKHVLGWL